MTGGTAAAGAAAAAVLAFAGSENTAAAMLALPAAAAALAAVGVLMWRKDSWRLDGSLRLRRGLLFQQETALHSGSVTLAEVSWLPVAALFGAVRVTVSTAFKGKNSGSNTLFLSVKESRRLINRLVPESSGREKGFRIKNGSLVSMAFFSSSVFSGLLLLAPLALWLAKRVDAALAADAYSAAYAAARGLSPVLTPWLFAAAALPGLCWLAHFIHTLLTCGGFRVERTDTAVTIWRGAVVRRMVRFPVKAVSAVKMRRIMFFSEKSGQSCSVLVPGCGYRLFVPSENIRRMHIYTASVFPHGEPGAVIRTAGTVYWWRWWATGGAAAAAFVLRLASDAGKWRGAVLLGGMPLAVLMVLRAMVGAAAARSAGIRFFTDSIEISGVNGLGVECLRVLRGNIAKVSVVQSPWQRASGLCSVKILPKGDARGMRCGWLPYEKCIAALGRMG